MANGLYKRVAGRGFPSSVVAGMTGAGALESQGSTVDPEHGGSHTLYQGSAQQTLTGFKSEGPPDPTLVILEGVWGLSGSVYDPDQTPGYGPGEFRTHAAPRPGHAGQDHGWTPEMEQLHEASQEIHSQDFGALRQRTQVPNPGIVEPPIDQWTNNSPGVSAQAPLTGGQRVLGGRDAIQGYDLRNQYGFDAGHKDRTTIEGNVVNAYIDPSERPFIVPQASGTFKPIDEVWGPEPWASDAVPAGVTYNDPSAYSPPPEPATLDTSLVEATPSAGWGF
jgi:hypothetical protein